MTDLEMLALAAKTAGHVLHPEWNCAEAGIFLGSGVDGDLQYVWNPLADDGDALRLAVRLQITVCNEHLSAGEVYCTRYMDEVFPSVTSVTDNAALIPTVNPEDYAATRRAIVLAAAEIGRTMRDV